MKENYAYCLVNYWVKEKGKTGLTIPFLIGAYSKIGEKMDIDSVVDLLQNHDQETTIYICGEMGNELMLTLKDDQIGAINKHFGKLYVDISNPEIFGHIENSDDLKSILRAQYQKYIDNETFSLVNGKWQEFTNDDNDLLSMVNAKCS